MAIIDRVAARREQALTRSWPVGVGTVLPFETRWGHDDSRFSPEDYEDYLATSNDVFSVVSARARLLAGLDLKFYSGRGTKKKELDSGRPVELHRYINEFWTTSRLARMDELSMGIWGETYWALEPPSAKSPLGEIWWLKASRMRPVGHETEYLDGYWYWPHMGGAPIHFSSDEVVWFRYPNPIDEFSAMSPLGAARLAADTARAMMTANGKLFEQGMNLAGLIVPPNDKMTFSKDQADDLERHLKSKFTGPKNAHRWAVLRYEAKFAQMSMSPKDAEFVAGLNMTFRQVCRAYGMQAVLHNDLEQASLGDANALERVEWSRALKPDAQFKAEEIREQYLPKFARDKGARAYPDHCEYDFSQIPALQESATEVWSRDQQMIDRGLLTINEWRERNGFPPVNWGERPWLPLNKAQVDKDGKLEAPGGAQPGVPPTAVQGGPPKVDAKGVPVKVPPDDEKNPVNKPNASRVWEVDHMQARQLLAAFGSQRLNGQSVR